MLSLEVTTSKAQCLWVERCVNIIINIYDVFSYWRHIALRPLRWNCVTGPIHLHTGVHKTAEMQVSTQVRIRFQSAVFLIVTSCDLVRDCQGFGDSCRLHLRKNK